MGVALGELVVRLEKGAPGPEGFDYAQAALDAVEQLSQDVPIVTSTTLAVRSGVDVYDLPADFLFLIEMPALVTSDNVLLSDGGIIPLATAWEERWYVEGTQIRFEPTPAYTLTRRLRYAARYVLVDGVWPRLSENGARLALLYGRYLALLAKAGVAGESGWRYKIGDEEVDKSRLGQALLEQVKGALDAYGAAVRQLKGYGGTQQRWSGDFLTDL
jgi:hypothetical protein